MKYAPEIEAAFLVNVDKTLVDEDARTVKSDPFPTSEPGLNSVEFAVRPNDLSLSKEWAWFRRAVSSLTRAVGLEVRHRSYF